MLENSQDATGLSKIDPFPHATKVNYTQLKW